MSDWLKCLDNNATAETSSAATRQVLRREAERLLHFLRQPLAHERHVRPGLVERAAHERVAKVGRPWLRLVVEEDAAHAAVLAAARDVKVLVARPLHLRVGFVTVGAAVRLAERGEGGVEVASSK